MLLKIYVVMTKQVDSGSIVTSPVIKPTSLNYCFNYLYFWLDSALIGEVYITLLFFFNETAIEY
jgi:hypothetical protein